MASLRVLLADSDSAFLSSAQRALSRQGYMVIPASSSRDAVDHLDSEAIDVVVADVLLPPRNGLEILVSAKAHVPAPPVILLTDAGNIGAAATGVRLGATDYLVKPLEDFTKLAVMIDRVAGISNQGDHAQPDQFAPAASTTRDPISRRLLSAASSGQALPQLLQLYADGVATLARAPRVFVLLHDNSQLRMACSNGFADEAEAAREFAVGGYDDFSWRVAEGQAMLWEETMPTNGMGGTTEPHRVLGLPLIYAGRVVGVALASAPASRESIPATDLEELNQITQQTSIVIELAKVQALAELRNPTDAATGLLSREHFFQQADREFRRSWRFAEPISALELDLDEFSRLRQILRAGEDERIMQKVAAAVRPRVRLIDIVGRLGDDTLGIVVLKGSREQAMGIGERLRRAVAEIEIQTVEQTWQVTASIGIASYPRDQCASVHDLFALAAQATRAAKRSGRNRVVSV